MVYCWATTTRNSSSPNRAPTTRLETPANTECLEATSKRPEAKLNRLAAKKPNRPEAKTNRLEAKLNRLTAKLNRLAANSNRLAAKINRPEAKLNRLTANLNRLTANLNRPEATFNRLEAKLDRPEAKINRPVAKINRPEAKPFNRPEAKFGRPEATAPSNPDRLGVFQPPRGRPMTVTPRRQQHRSEKSPSTSPHRSTRRCRPRPGRKTFSASHRTKSGSPTCQYSTEEQQQQIPDKGGLNRVAARREQHDTTTREATRATPALLRLPSQPFPSCRHRPS